MADPQLGPQPLLPAQAPPVETLGPSPVIYAMEPQMALQATLGAERPPAQVTIREPSEAFKQLVNTGLTGDPYDAIQRPGKAPTTIPWQMKVLGIAAAAQGNYGVIAGHLDMQRKAKVWNEFNDTIPEMNRLMADGNTEKALALLQQAQARMTTISPELGAMVKPYYDKIYEQQKVQKFSDHTVAAMNVDFYSKSPEYQKANAHLHKAQVEKVKLARSFPNMEMANSYLQRNVEQSITPVPGESSVLAFNRLGTDMRQIPLDILFKEQDLNNPVGDAFSAMVGKTKAEITNILRHPEHPEHQLLKNVYLQTQGTKAALELSKGQPGDPKNLDALKLQLEQAGVPKDQIAWLVATRGVSAGPLGDPAGAGGEKMFEGARNRSIEEAGLAKERLTMADYNVPLEVTPHAQNSVIVGKRASGDDFGVVRNNMSLREANESGGKYIRLDKSIYEGQVTPLLDAIAILKNGGELYKYLGNPETFTEQGLAGVWSNIARYIPGAAGPRDVRAEVLRAVIGRALETIEAKGANLPDALRGSMKNLIRGDFANANAAISGLQQAVTIADQHLDRLMGDNALSVTRPLETPQEQREQSRTLGQQGSTATPTLKNLSAAADTLTTPQSPEDRAAYGPRLTIKSSVRDVQEAIVIRSRRLGFNPLNMLNLYDQESGGFNVQPHTKGSGGEYPGGLGQFTKPTAETRKLDVKRLRSDPDYNLNESLRYLSDLKKKYGGDERKAMHAYNGFGPTYLRDVDQHTAKNQKVLRTLGVTPNASSVAPDAPNQRQMVAPTGGVLHLEQGKK